METNLIKEPNVRGHVVDSAEKIKEAEYKYTKKLIEQQLSSSTKRVYKSDWRIFDDWCCTRQYQSIALLPQ